MEPFRITPSLGKTRSAGGEAAAVRSFAIFLHWPWQLTILGVAFALIIAGAPARAADGPPALLGLPSASDVARFVKNAQQPEPGVVRHKPVSVNFQYVAPEAGPSTQIKVDLFDGAAVTLDLDRVETRGPDNYTWYGRVEGYPKGHAVLTVVNGQMSGAIELGDTGLHAGDSYQIQGRADGSHVMRQIEQSAFPPDHPPGAGDPLAPTLAKEALFGPSSDTGDRSAVLFGPPSSDKADPSAGLTSIVKADSGAIVDVMVVYSNQTASAAGTAIGAQIQQAVDTANLVYANSGITLRLRLVDYQQVNYNESGDYPTDLNWLTSDATVASLRNTYGADLVGMFVESSQYCGYSWIGPSASYAFSVINRSCSTGNYSYPHETGHLFGARHDVYVDPTTSPYAYGHGYVNCVEGWRDVMAYPTQCGGTRIPYFSNPNMAYGSPLDPLGTTNTADVVLVHNQNAVTVANFRLSTSGGGGGACTYAMSPTSASFSASGSSGSFAVTTGSGCTWNSSTNASWLAITTGSGTSGSGTFNYSVSANVGPARSAAIVVAGQPFTVNQASGCTYTLASSSATVAATGGSGTTALTTASGCTWTAASSAAWLSISSAGTGSGSATVSYAAAANTGSARSANLTIGGVTFVLTQSAAANPPPTAPAIASLAPTALSFGNQSVGRTTSAKTATLTNTGAAPLTVTSVSLGGANPADFKPSGTCATNVALTSGLSCTLRYQFAPRTSGARSATVSVTTSAGNVTLSLSGTGTTGHKPK